MVGIDCRKVSCNVYILHFLYIIIIIIVIV